jgi:hypothetical protein
MITNPSRHNMLLFLSFGGAALAFVITIAAAFLGHATAPEIVLRALVPVSLLLLSGAQLFTSRQSRGYFLLLSISVAMSIVAILVFGYRLSVR